MEKLRKNKNKSCKKIVKTLSNIHQDLHVLIGKYLKTIYEEKICLTLNKPIYVGFTVLETRKWEMYNFHYNFMIRKLNTRLSFTDTDSLCYEIHGKNQVQRKNVRVQRTI